MLRACARFRFLRIAEVECCASLHRRTQGGEVCGMGIPVHHMVFRLCCLECCMFQQRALRFEADVDWGSARGVCFRCCTLSCGTCGMFIKGVYYCIAVKSCSMLVCYDIPNNGRNGTKRAAIREYISIQKQEQTTRGN